MLYLRVGKKKAQKFFKPRIILEPKELIPARLVALLGGYYSLTFGKGNRGTSLLFGLGLRELGFIGWNGRILGKDCGKEGNSWRQKREVSFPWARELFPEFPRLNFPLGVFPKETFLGRSRALAGL